MELLAAIPVYFSDNQRLANIYQPISARLHQEWSQTQVFPLIHTRTLKTNRHTLPPRPNEHLLVLWSPSK